MKKHLSQSASSSMPTQLERNITNSLSQVPYPSSIGLSAFNSNVNSNENLSQNSTDEEDSSELTDEDDADEDEEIEEDVDVEEDDDLETNSLSIEDIDETGQQQATSSST